MSKARKFTKSSAIQAIDRNGALLVFPIENKSEPESIWSCFYPGQPMLWEWDESGDDRVARLWHLRGDLSTTRQVVYTKWYRGRATYFSRELFAAMLAGLNPELGSTSSLGAEARSLLRILESESPLSTKELKRQSGLNGKANESTYQRALKELWDRLLIVAFGEVDDGAFPSLAIGATRLLYEDLWEQASHLSQAQAFERIAGILPNDSLFLDYYLKLRKPPSIRHPGRTARSRKIKSVIRFEDL